MEFSFEVRAVLSLEYNKGDDTSKHNGISFNLTPSKNIDKKAYLNEEDLPTKEGSRVITSVLVQALIGNLHMCHELGYKDSAEHLRLIISELERGFQEVAITNKSTF